MKAGLAVNPHCHLGVGFVDFDNDGWLDVFQVNGHVFPDWRGEWYANPRSVGIWAGGSLRMSRLGWD